jgi:2-methylcitrate dehydratase PrpD
VGDFQQRAGQWLAGLEGTLPPPVDEACRLALVDWLGVTLGGLDEPAARIARAQAAHLFGPGPCAVLGSGYASPAAAALANGTAAHCLDFDDTHVGAVTHVGAPLWAALLACLQSRLSRGNCIDERALLRAFAAGYQVAARAGTGLGEQATARGWHGTGVFGRIGAAAGCAALAGLDAEGCSHALGLAATQAAGLVASFGTMAKPLHAGKAAADGLLAATLAEGGFRGAANLLGPEGALARALVQQVAVPADLARPVDDGWEVLANSVKPYAACHLTHPAVDAARLLRPQLGDAQVGAVVCSVGALAVQVTGSRDRVPTCALEAKFDLPWCVALALRGHAVSADDFREPWSAPPDVAALARRVRLLEDDGSGFASASVEVQTEDGRTLSLRVDPALGHPGNPIGWEALRRKYLALAAPVLGRAAESLFEAARALGHGATWPDIAAALDQATCERRT